MSPHLATKLRKYVGFLWLLLLLVALYIYFFHAAYAHTLFLAALAVPPLYAALIFLAIGCLRAFTLIPSTYIILLGLLFFDPWPLYFLVVAGIMVSSAAVFKFSSFLHLDSFFESKYHKQVSWVRRLLEKNELPIIIGWSMAPFLPTDVICYVAGTLQVNFRKFLLGLFIGEAIVCAIYIFGGEYLLTLCSYSWCHI